MNRGTSVYKFVLDLLFPNRCPFCDEFIKWDKKCCDNCFSEIFWTDDNVCSKCGKDCCICSEELYYDRCYTAMYYRGIVKNAVYALKTQNGINFADIVADNISSKIIADGIQNKIDYIVPVPMSKKKLRIRNYNQADEIAKSLKRILKININRNILYKHHKAIQQHTLNAEQRKLNVVDMFYSNSQVDLKGKTILLCDDVLTTASTVNECSRILKSKGAKCVIVVAATTTSIIL